MLRDLFTNKWVLGGIGFLIVFAFVCYLWYQHDIADDKKAVAEAEKLLRQSQIYKKVADTDSETEQAAGVVVENNPLTTEKPITEDILEMSPTDEIVLDQNKPRKTIIIDGREIVIPEVPKTSPFGFGAFPKVPKDYRGGVVWLQTNYYELPPHEQKDFELLDRVLIKLWSEGEKNFKGGKYDKYNGKVYPNYFNKIYITVEERRSADGSLEPIITHQFGVAAKDIDIFNPSTHIEVLDYDSSGIAPYEYLNLP